MFQMKGQNNTSVKYLNKEEKRNLPDEEFKIVVV